MKNKTNKTTETKNDKTAASPATPAATKPADKVEVKKPLKKARTVKPMKERHIARWNALTRRALAHITPQAIGAILAAGNTPRLVLDGSSVKVETVEAAAKV